MLRIPLVVRRWRFMRGYTGHLDRPSGGALPGPVQVSNVGPPLDTWTGPTQCSLVGPVQVSNEAAHLTPGPARARALLRAGPGV